jgi:hypothetical protein
MIDIWPFVPDMFQNSDHEAAWPHKEPNGPIFQSLGGSKERRNLGRGNEARTYDLNLQFNTDSIPCSRTKKNIEQISNRSIIHLRESRCHDQDIYN